MNRADSGSRDWSRDWREQLLWHGLRGAGLALMVIPPLLFFSLSHPRKVILGLPAFGVAAFALSRFIERAPRFLSHVFLATGYLAVFAYGYDLSWSPGVVAGLCGLVVFAGLLQGARAVAAVIVLTAVLLLAGGTLVSLGRYTPRLLADLDPAIFTNWLRGGLVFTFLSAAAALGIHFVIQTIRRAEENAQDALSRQNEELVMAESARVRQGQQESELREAQKLQTIAQLGAGFAHRFNNFLTTIRFAVDELRHAANPPALSETADFIAKSVATAASKTRDLLMLSRPHRSQVAPRDLDVVLGAVQGKVAGRLRDNVTLTMESKPVGIVGISDSWLEQILMNLLLNAEQAMPEGGAVQVSTEIFQFESEHRGTIQPLPPGRYAALVVSDSGCGMDSAVAMTACEPFFTTKGRDGHDGLGLTLVYSMARQLGGSLEFIRLAAGMRVLVYFPVLAPEFPWRKAGAESADPDSAPTARDHVATSGGAVVSAALPPVIVPSAPGNWEDRTLDRLLRGSFFLAAVATVGAIFAVGMAYARIALVLGGANLLALGLGGWQRRWSATARKAILLGVIGGTGAVATIVFSYLLPTPVVLLFLWVLLAVLYTNAAVTVVVLVAVLVVFLLGGWLHQRGIVTASFPHISPALARNWYRVAVLLSLSPCLVAIVVAHVLRVANTQITALAAARRQLQWAQSQRQAEFEGLSNLQHMSSRAARMEAVGRLTGTVAHDLNNSLQIIGGWAELLRAPDPSPAENREEAIHGIHQAADYAEALIDQLQLGSESQGMPGSVDVGTAVLGMRPMLATILGRKSRASLDLSATEECYVRIAEPSFRRLVLNLVSNAGEALSDRSEQGCCQVQMSRVEQEVVLCVQDNGGGMDSEMKQKIFSPFFTTKPGSGTGLGLFSVARIAETTKGRIEVITQVKEGSRFVIRWPLADPPPVAAARPDVVARTIALGRILLAEDEPAVRHMLVRGLRRGGFEVWESQDGDRAMEELGRGLALDALCIDAIMPGRPTVSVIEEFSRLYPGRPVVLISGHLPAEFDSSTLTHGHVSFLHKPFTSAALIDEIARRMGKT